LGLDGTVFRVSDDGEPSGSAGRPILGQIDSKQVTNVAVVVVRYFGGTLLGVPGLINAYKTATSLALQLTPIIAKPILIHYLLRFDYTQMNEVLRLLRQFECTVGNMQNQLFSTLEAGIPRNRLDDVMYKLRDLRGIEIVEK
jgi:putative IMPACT (imprinted ancient) family translation regulator